MAPSLPEKAQSRRFWENLAPKYTLKREVLAKKKRGESIPTPIPLLTGLDDYVVFVMMNFCQLIHTTFLGDFTAIFTGRDKS